jgi:hypothetical protein
VGKPIPQPFTSIEHVVVDAVNNVRIVHAKRTRNEITDYYRYANLLVYKALLHLQQGDRESALRELGKLEELWDGVGFADAYHQETGNYEAYKLALAVYTYRALRLQDNIDEYMSKLMSINPFTTLYTNSKGEGDLNLDTATITLLTLYSTLPHTSTQKPTPTIIIIIATTLIAIVATTLIIKLPLPKNPRGSRPWRSYSSRETCRQEGTRSKGSITPRCR